MEKRAFDSDFPRKRATPISGNNHQKTLLFVVLIQQINELYYIDIDFMGDKWYNVCVSKEFGGNIHDE